MARAAKDVFEGLCDSERIELAKKKIEKVLDQVLALAAIHENNAFVVFSPKLADQIPRSYAAHAFGFLQHAMHDLELVRLCALWDKPDPDKQSVPTVVELIDRPSVIEALVQTERAHWGEITANNMASLNPELTEAEIEAIRHTEDQFGEKRAALVRSDLSEAIRETERILVSDCLTRVRNYRDKHLAHSLAVTRAETKAGAPIPLRQYAHAFELFDATIPIVEKLYRCITGKGFDIGESQKISRKCAEDLWNRCTFTFER
jgi:hypothetical protein